MFSKNVPLRKCVHNDCSSIKINELIIVKKIIQPVDKAKMSNNVLRISFGTLKLNQSFRMYISRIKCEDKIKSIKISTNCITVFKEYPFCKKFAIPIIPTIKPQAENCISQYISFLFIMF